jgi:uncharacterized damage-inducible protein DinB
MATHAFEKESGNREFYVQRWDQEYPAFVRIFKALPADKLDYRPHPKSRSAGELVAMHNIAQKSCLELCTSRKSMYSGMHWQEPKGYDGLDGMIAEFEADSARFRKELQKLDDTAWHHQAWLIEGDREILLKDTVGGLLWIALFDLVHHRGQLSTYIRPMGGKVPSIYGPSGDSSV